MLLRFVLDQNSVGKNTLGKRSRRWNRPNLIRKHRATAREPKKTDCDAGLPLEAE